MTNDRNVITLGRRGAVATVSFVRTVPASEYAAMAQEILFLLDVATSEAGVVVLNIVGDRVFPADAGVGHEALHTYCDPIVRRIRDAPVAIVASVEGAATGGGCAIALACDFIVAGETASFTWPARLTHEGSDCVWARTPSAAAGAHANEVLMLSRPVSAVEARNWGLVNRVAPSGQSASIAADAAARLATVPQPTLQVVKQLCRTGAEQRWRDIPSQARASGDGPLHRGPSRLH